MKTPLQYVVGALAFIAPEGQKCGEFSRHWSPDIVTVMPMPLWPLMPLSSNAEAFPEQAHEELFEFISASPGGSRS